MRFPELIRDSRHFSKLSINELILPWQRLDIFSQFLNFFGSQSYKFVLLIKFFFQTYVLLLDLFEFLVSFLDSLHVLVFFAVYLLQIMLNLPEFPGLFFV